MSETTAQVRLNFIAARKFAYNNVKGLELRSAGKERAVVFNTKGEGYAKVRNAVAAFNMSRGTEAVRAKGIGKSYEITGKETMKFLESLNFVNESHNEFVAFFNAHIDEIGNVISLELDPKACKMEMEADVAITVDDGAEKDEKANIKRAFDEFVTRLLPIIEKYDIGILLK